MAEKEGTIQNVSDTALWVAHYRAQESERPDALFRDPLAKALVGEKGEKIARSMKHSSKYTAWSLPIRTVIIDDFVSRLVQEGVELVVNLGAGLDTRPYRMNLPSSLQWVEVDYPHMIDHKEAVLARESPRCRLERVRLDLAEEGGRRALLASLASRSQRALVLTEGVIPYLTEEQVAALAEDLRAHPQFQFWIGEYIAPVAYKYLRSPKRMQRMKNAPFRFFPVDWFGFFREKGWRAKDTKYLVDESGRLGRKVPAPWWAFIFRLVASREEIKKRWRFMAYTLFERV
jgi:methyltransferase (TIGR00027 family)